MRTIVLVAAASALLIPVSTAPAHAAVGRDVQPSVSIVTVPLDNGGGVVLAICNAEAHSSNLTDVPVATSVTCSVNGVEASRSMPGGESYVDVSNTVPSMPFTVCVSGQAAFVNSTTDEIELVSDGPYCEARTA